MRIDRDNKIFESLAYKQDENRFYNIKMNFPSADLILYSDEESYVIATYRITGKQAKITSVYTPKEDRKKAYATNLIHDMSGLLLDMGLTPLLYTNYNYPASNTAYINAGYEDTGVLINFSCRPEKNDAATNVAQAKERFSRVLSNQTYAGIIRDDKHLTVILDLVKTGDYESILDIGTGTGYLAFPLAKMYPNARVYGIDIAEVIMEKNMEIVQERGISNLTFMAFDGLEYPFAEESFDLIISRYAFHHFPRVEFSVQQMYRLLKKGGKVLISDPMRHPADTKGVIDDFMDIKQDGHIQFYSAEELEGLFVRNGFAKEAQTITDMKFPLPPKQEYLELYDKTSQENRAHYDITRDENIVWVKDIQVGNTLFVKP